jgi:hypothetical protein
LPSCLADREQALHRAVLRIAGVRSITNRLRTHAMAA